MSSWRSGRAIQVWMPRRLLGPWRAASGLRSEWVTPLPATIQFSAPGVIT